MAEIYLTASAPLPFESIMQSDWSPTSVSEGVGCFAGDTLDILFAVRKGGQPVSLLGCSGDFVVSDAPGDAPLLEELTVPIGNDPADFANMDGYGIAVDEPGAGIGHVRLSDNETDTLGAGTFYYELEFDLNGNSCTVQFGSFTINVDTA